MYSSLYIWRIALLYVLCVPKMCSYTCLVCSVRDMFGSNMAYNQIFATTSDVEEALDSSGRCASVSANISKECQRSRIQCP